MKDKKNKYPDKQVNVLLDPITYAKLEARLIDIRRASYMSLNMGDIVRAAIEHYLDRFSVEDESFTFSEMD